MAEIIRLLDRRRAGAALKTTTDMLMPLQVRRGRRAKARQRLGSVAMRKALHELEEQGWRVADCLRWLHEVAKSNPDPRAIAEMVEDWDTDEEVHELFGPGDVPVTMRWLAAFAKEWARRMKRRQKPTLVKPS